MGAPITDLTTHYSSLAHAALIDRSIDDGASIWPACLLARSIYRPALLASYTTCYALYFLYNPRGHQYRGSRSSVYSDHLPFHPGR